MTNTPAESDLTPSLVIFDCDGVLVDTEPVVQRILSGWLTEHGWPMTAEESARTIKGGHILKIQAELESRIGRAVPDFVEGYRARMFAAFEDGIDEIAGAASVLDAIADAGIPVCVASNGPHVKMDASLRSSGLLDRLGGIDGGRIFSADDVGVAKPDPKLFLHAAERMGFEPADCVVVDDSVPGIHAGLAAQMRTIAYEDMTPGAKLLEAGAERVLENLMDLLPALGLDPVAR